MGNGSGRSSSGSVVTYMCSTAWSGTGTPAIAPTARAQAPAQLTTVPQRMAVPSLRRTAWTAPLRRSMPAQATPSRMRTPAVRAPFAYAMHTSTGFACPSSATHSAPARSSTLRLGAAAATSSCPTMRASRPAISPTAAMRRSSTSRSSVRASQNPPVRR